VIKKLFIFITVGIFLVNLFLASFSLSQGEIHFFSDLARDFLLFQELSHKWIVLIGPRANATGVFHGPLWNYINLPIYLLSQGNPIAHAGFWFFLTATFTVLGAYLIKKMFGTYSAGVFAILFSGLLIYRGNDSFIHAYASVFPMIPLTYLMIRYLQKGKLRHLIGGVVTTGIIVQLSISTLPFIGYTSLFALIGIFRHKKYFHIFSLALFPILLLNFFVFDLRYNHSFFQGMMKYSESQRVMPIDITYWQNRLSYIIDLKLAEFWSKPLTIFTFVSTIFLTLYLIVKNRTLRLSQIYFLGFFILFYVGTLFSKGVLLYHYVFPLSGLTTMWFSSLAQKKLTPFICLLALIIATLNIQSMFLYTNTIQKDFINKHYNSWVGMTKVANEIVKEQSGRPFGYFVFAPDAFAYQPRYAMIYNFRNLVASEYVKQSTTYIIAQPPPQNDPYMTYLWWRIHSVKIDKQPEKTWKFPNGFVVEKFSLSPEEISFPHDKTMELGIHFR